MRSRTEPRGSGGHDGFTLIELLMAIAIIGIITVPLSNVVIAYLRNTDATTARLIESHDVQIASAYWAQDVASIGTRSTTDPYSLKQSVWTGASSLYSCPTAGTPIVSLAWDDFSSTGAVTLVQVVYAVSGQTELHRVRCQQSSGVVTVGPDVTVAHELNPDMQPTVACDGASPDPTDCTAAPGVPKTVTLKLSLKDPDSDSAYDVTLTGQRRQSS